MPQETVSTKKARLAIARRIIKDTLEYEDFKVTKKIRFGPRYYVARGLRNKRQTIFKICLFSDSVDHLTNEKFSREIIFLDFVQNSKFNKVKKAAPHVYAWGIKPRAWYIREHIQGQLQNIKGGNVKFTKSFFNQKNQLWLIDLFTDLQSIKDSDLHNNFKKLLYPPDFTKNLWRFISPHWQRVENYMRWPGLARLIRKKFKFYAPIYNKAPRVLAHQEPYSCHLIKTKMNLRLIDWENIGWANPAHDPVVIWMRAHQKPAWQKQFYQRFRRQWPNYKKFNDLWTIEVLIQSVFNVISIHFYKNRNDIIGLVKFSDKKIREILTDNFKIYN